MGGFFSGGGENYAQALKLIAHIAMQLTEE
jgi:hypothetical protein